MKAKRQAISIMIIKTIEDLEGLTEAQETQRGKLIAEMLNLKSDGKQPSPNYKTTWGTKTALGLYRVVKRIILDGE